MSRARATAGRVRTGVRRVPRAGRVCALIALVNAIIWSVVIPPFQVPDEISHFGYAQYLAEHGAPPPQRPGVAQYSDEQQTALTYLRFFTIVGRSDQPALRTDAEDAALRAALAAGPSRDGPGGASSATNQPPLYYALQAVPYWLSPSHDILFRLQMMRLLSALLAALTVLCVFLFLRELLPGTPWAWTVGALAVAFQPSFMFISAGVHGDNLLYLASAAVLLALARAFRRGLTTRRAAAIGAATAVGVLGKLTFLAFLPGIALAFALLAWRQRRAPREALTATGTAAAITAIPVGLYALLNVALWDRSGGATGGGVSGAMGATDVVSVRERLSYIWQLVLPRLPFMQDQFTYFPLRERFFRGFIGHFGWLDYQFPAWVYDVAGVVFVVLVALAMLGVVAAVRRIGPRELAWRVPFAVVLATMVAGLVAAIGWQGITYRVDTGFAFEQARYLFPLLALYGLLVALAARGAGRRWGPALGAALVVLAMAHGLFAQMLTVARYYG